MRAHGGMLVGPKYKPRQHCASDLHAHGSNSVMGRRAWSSYVHALASLNVYNTVCLSDMTHLSLIL